MGQLSYGPNPLGVPWRRVGQAFLGRLASRPNPFGALGLGRLARGARPGPKVPTGGAEAKWLVDRKGDDGVVIPKADGVGHQ